MPDGQLALFPGYRLTGQTWQGVVYPLDPPDWLVHACSIVRRDLTRAEWAVYLPGRPDRPTCNGEAWPGFHGSMPLSVLRGR